MDRGPARNLIIAIVALALLAVALLLVVGPTQNPYLDLLRRGDERAANVERTAAVALYTEAAHLRPDEPASYLRMAQLYLDWGRIDEALAALAEAETRLAGTPGDAAQSADLERLWVAAHVAWADWPAVVEHAQRLLALVPDDQDARHALARAYVHLQAWDAAQAEYEALLLVDPADTSAHEMLGVLALGDNAVATRHLFAAETDLARQLLVVLSDPAAVDDPAYARALQGHALIAAGEWTLATRQLRRALVYNPLYADAYAYLGYALDQVGRPGEAEPYLLQAVALASDSVKAHVFLGLHYDRLGDHATARAEYEAAYDLDPENPAVCVEIGQAWAAEGSYVAAEIWLQQAVALRPDDPALWEILARFYLDHAITVEERGVAAAERFLELAPDDARAHDLLGWAVFQIGDYDTAQAGFLVAISIDPALAVAYYHLGLLRQVQGKPGEADDAFRRAVDLDTTGALAPLVERAMDF